MSTWIFKYGIILWGQASGIIEFLDLDYGSNFFLITDNYFGSCDHTGSA